MTDGDGSYPSAIRGLVIHKSEAAIAEIRSYLEPRLPCDGARSLEEAIDHLRSRDYAIVFLEHRPPDLDSTSALFALVVAAPDALIVVHTSEPGSPALPAEGDTGRVFRFVGGREQRHQLVDIATEGLRLIRLEREQRELVRSVAGQYEKLQKRERLLDMVVNERTRELHVAYERLKAANRQALLGLAEAIEAKDPYTKGHCGRVAAYSMALARVARYPQADLETLEFASFLHDIGKLGVRDAVLLKPAPLDDEEWKHMRIHPTVGDQIASQIDLLAPMRPAIRNHHERWDGKGYPDGIAGEALPLSARIVCIADAVDAMLTERPYKPAQSLEECHFYLRKGQGKQFDPELIDLFIDQRVAEQLLGDGGADEELIEPAPVDETGS